MIIELIQNNQEPPKKKSSLKKMSKSKKAVAKEARGEEFSPIATNQSGLVYFDTKPAPHGCVSARGPAPTMFA